MPNGGNVLFVDRCPHCRSGRYHELSVVNRLLLVNLLLPRYRCDRCRRLFYVPTTWMETEAAAKKYKSRRRHFRQRATAVVFKGNAVLLVRDRGKRHYSLPGGGIHRHEHATDAAKRELYEELSLKAASCTRLRQFDFRGVLNRHHICLVEAQGEPHIRGGELASYRWWDMKDNVLTYRYVKRVATRVRRFVEG